MQNFCVNSCVFPENLANSKVPRHIEQTTVILQMFDVFSGQW